VRRPLGVREAPDPDAVRHPAKFGGHAGTVASATIVALQRDPPGRTMGRTSGPAPAPAMTTSNIRVLLCHHHAGLRTGLERLLDASDGIEVVAAVGNGDEGVAATTRLHPDVVLMDLAMPRVNGVAATRRIAALVPRSQVLVLTGFPHPDRIRDAIAAGATGFVLKDATPLALLSAVRSAAETELHA
jgi:CheY-like chemotaxis protein